MYDVNESDNYSRGTIPPYIYMGFSIFFCDSSQAYSVIQNIAIKLVLESNVREIGNIPEKFAHSICRPIRLPQHLELLLNFPVMSWYHSTSVLINVQIPLRNIPPSQMNPCQSLTIRPECQARYPLMLLHRKDA